MHIWKSDVSQTSGTNSIGKSWKSLIMEVNKKRLLQRLRDQVTGDKWEMKFEIFVIWKVPIRLDSSHDFIILHIVKVEDKYFKSLSILMSINKKIFSKN